MAAAAPGSGPTGLGEVTFDQLGICELSTEGAKIKASGALAKVEWPEFSSKESDRTGYYLAMTLTGDEGAYVGKTTPSNEWKAVPVSDCADGWIVAVRKDAKSFTFQAFKDGGDAAAKRDGTTYTVDLSRVTYGE